jgi:glycosyltransferase involved in cell wall biosynthesis
MSQLSVVIITLNEEENIARCIESVKGIADEVVVVDSFSTDRTCEMAKSMGARVIQHKFEGYVKQKNFANQQATFPYMLSLDADEYLSEELKASIASAKADFKFDGYSMNRLNFYCGKPIKTSGWYPDKKIRLWNNTKAQWTGVYLHEILEMAPGATVSHLPGNLLHNTFPTPESYRSQAEKFATIRAQELKGRNIFYLLLKLTFSAPFKFLRTYFLKLGFSDGAVGFTICYNQSREVFLKYFRAIKFKYS